MASTGSETPSSSLLSSSSSISGSNYDVFLSFRGEDTRHSFTDHLYEALRLRDIEAFIDCEKLQLGQQIASELLQAIEKSQYAIVVFSKKYADSRWCLDELAEIVECKKNKGLKVMPVFYHVDPSDVQKQTGPFEKAFNEYQKNDKIDREKIQKWKDAMREVGNLSGVHLPPHQRFEAKCIQDIVKVISNELSYTFSKHTKGLIGMESRVEKLKSLLAIESNDARIIGIWGTGGMGKTTLARTIYRMVSYKFDACCFIANVREESKKCGLCKLQEILLKKLLMLKNLNVQDVDDGIRIIKNRLHNKKILLVLDDVNELDQLNKLAGERCWFGSGSRIMITTRDGHLLVNHEVTEIYKAEELNQDEALKLFSLKAFKMDHPTKDYGKLSQAFVDYSKGLPLALEVLGSFLYDKSIDEWKSELDRLKIDFCDRGILKVFQISFDGLQPREKDIFLHIACFFNHKKEDDVIKILDYLDLYPQIGLKVLINKFLVKLHKDQLWMHDLLQEMGRYIVCQECHNPAERSRLWSFKDIDDVLIENTGTKEIQGMVLELHEPKNVKWNPEAFSRMQNLKLLKICGIQLMHDLKHLPNSLRVLYWREYSSKPLTSGFQSKGTEVVEVRYLDSDWVDLAAIVPFHPVDQKDKGSQSPPSQSPHDRLSWARKEARWKAPYDRSYLARKEARWIGRLNLKPSQLLIIDWGLKMSPSQLLIIDLELVMSRKLESLPMMMDWGIKLPSQMRVMMLPFQMRAMMNLDSQMRAIGEIEEAESSSSSTKLKRLEMMDPGIKLPSQMRAIGEIEEAESPRPSKKLKRLESSSLIDRGIKLPSRAMMNLEEIEEEESPRSSTKWKRRAIGEIEEAESPRSSKKLKRLESSSLMMEEIEEAESPRSSTKWKKLYLKIVESEIKEAESLPSELLPGPSERNKLYFFFWHAYSPVMYSLYEVDVPIPLPPPPSKADQDDRISNPKSLSPILQLKTGKYADGMCCVQLGSILYFLGGEMNIDNPYIDEDVKKELKNVKLDVLPKIVYTFDLAIDHEVKDNDDLPTSTPMKYGKASPLAFVADEKIYVIGSTIQDLEGDRIPSFEMFDPKVDEWSVLKIPPEINVNIIWVGHAVVGRKALLVGWQQGKKRLYCFDLVKCEWANISIPYCAGNLSGNIEFVGNTLYGCYYKTVAAIAPLVGEEKDELKEEEEKKEEAREENFQQMFKHHRLLQVSEEMGMDAIFNGPPQLQCSSSLLHLGKMYFCYVRTGMPPHPDPILASDLVIGDDKKRFISVVIFQAMGKTCGTRFFRAKFLHSEHYVVDSPFPNDGFIRGCYVFGWGSTESSKQISV